MVKIVEKTAYQPPWFQYQNAFIIGLTHILYGLQVTWVSAYFTHYKQVHLEEPSVTHSSQIMSSYAIGELFSPTVVAIIGNKIGRKTSTVCAVVATILANLSILQISTTDPIHWIFFSRLLNGMLLGWACTIAPTYIGETTTPTIRGKLLSNLTIQLNIGLCLGYIFNGYVTYYVFCWVLVGLSVSVCFLTCTLVESPYYSVLKNNEDVAFTSLRRLKISGDESRDLSDIKWQISIQQQNTAKWKELISNRANKLACLLGVAFQVCNVSTAIDIVIVYLLIILEKAEISKGARTVSSILFAGAGVLMMVGSTMLIDSWGRRPLLFLSSFLTSTFLFLTGFYFYLDQIGISLHLGMFPVVCLICYKISVGIGLGSLPRVCIGELFTAEFAPYGSFVCRSIYHVLVIVVLNYYPGLEVTIGMGGVLMCFAFLCLMFGVVLVYVLPETKNKSLSEIQDMIENLNVLGKCGGKHLEMNQSVINS